jgi:hypothetical protein
MISSLAKAGSAAGTNVLGLILLLVAALSFFFITGVVFSTDFSFHKKAVSESLSSAFGTTNPVGRGTGGSDTVGCEEGTTGDPNKDPCANPNPDPLAGAVAEDKDAPNSPEDPNKPDPPLNRLELAAVGCAGVVPWPPNKLEFGELDDPNNPPPPVAG